jgi:Uma2 family endonuclease
MIARATDDNPFVLLTGVPWDVYERFTDALAGHRLRHTYIDGKFELRKEVFGVAWKSYRAMLEALGDFHLRHIYDQGYLLLMSPLQSHDWVKRLIGRFIESMAFDQQLAIKSIGSTTITSEDEERGFEPDEAYYIASEPKVRGKLEFEPDVDPPPDLIVEIDVTSSSLDQLSLYAAMGVPEVWIHDGKHLQFLTRNRRGKYDVAETSRAFPFLAPSDIEKFLKQRGDMDETSLTREFAAWARRKRGRSLQTKPATSKSKRPPKGRKK